MIDDVEKINSLLDQVNTYNINPRYMQLLHVIKNIKYEQALYLKTLSKLPYPDEIKAAKIQEEEASKSLVASRKSKMLIINQEDEKKLLDPLEKDVLIEQRLLLEATLEQISVKKDSHDELAAIAAAIEDIDQYLLNVYDKN